MRKLSQKKHLNLLTDQVVEVLNGVVNLSTMYKTGTEYEFAEINLAEAIESLENLADYVGVIETDLETAFGSDRDFPGDDLSHYSDKHGK